MPGGQLRQRHALPGGGPPGKAPGARHVRQANNPSQGANLNLPTAQVFLQVLDYCADCNAGDLNLPPTVYELRD